MRTWIWGSRGRRAIVTGGGSGIGYETARLFLEEGARVLICGRNADKINKARDELAKKTGGEIHAVQADMTKEADIKRMVDTAKEKLGGVDILVNNAGTMYSGRFAVLDDNEMKNQLETKLFGFHARDPSRLSDDEGAEVGPHRQHDRRRRQGTRPLHVRQRHDQRGAAQSHQVAVDRIRRGQRAGQRHLPGLGRHQSVARNAEGLKQELGAKSEEEARRLAAKKNSLNRFGKPEELANATVFLCSERASYITGVSLNLDGGRLKGLW